MSCCFPTSKSKSMDASSASSLLANTKLRELLRSQSVVTIKDSASVDHTLRVLAAHRILSAPVIGGSEESNSTSTIVKDVVGFIDIRDILASFLQEVNVPELKDAKMLKRMRIFEDSGVRFAGQSIKQLKSLGSDGWFYNVDAAANASLREIIHDGFLYPKESNRQIFGGSRMRSIVHRLALFNTEGHLTNIISQSDVIKYIHEHLSQCGDLGNATVTDLGLAKKSVVTVTPDTPALDAMVLMEDKNISAVAVVNTKDAIIGNFSISELRTIMAEHFGSLALPVGEFLALEHGTEYAGYAIQRDDSVPAEPSPAGFQFAKDRDMRRRQSLPGSEVGQLLITCRPDDTFSSVLERLVRNRLHRLYVCDPETFKPLGVITLTDILRFLVGS